MEVVDACQHYPEFREGQMSEEPRKMWIGTTLSFARQPNGMVLVEYWPLNSGEPEMSISLTVEEWASVVSWVSSAQTTAGEPYETIRKFHEGKK
jgi:hypothetical protein